MGSMSCPKTGFPLNSRPSCRGPLAWVFGSIVFVETIFYLALQRLTDESARLHCCSAECFPFPFPLLALGGDPPLRPRLGRRASPCDDSRLRMRCNVSRLQSGAQTEHTNQRRDRTHTLCSLSGRQSGLLAMETCMAGMESLPALSMTLGAWHGLKNLVAACVESRSALKPKLRRARQGTPPTPGPRGLGTYIQTPINYRPSEPIQSPQACHVHLHCRRAPVMKRR